MSLFRSLIAAAVLALTSPGAIAQPIGAPRNPVSVHVLDLQTGQPSAGISVTIERREDAHWVPLAEAVTDTDGRVEALYPAGTPLQQGEYRLTFQTGAWFKARHTETLYPVVQIVMAIDGSAGHYHVPLLLSPYGYSTYRGS